jgi:hypothetical protein
VDDLGCGLQAGPCTPRSHLREVREEALTAPSFNELSVAGIPADEEDALLAV